VIFACTFQSVFRRTAVIFACTFQSVFRRTAVIFGRTFRSFFFDPNVSPPAPLRDKENRLFCLICLQPHGTGPAHSRWPRLYSFLFTALHPEGRIPQLSDSYSVAAQLSDPCSAFAQLPDPCSAPARFPDPYSASVSASSALSTNGTTAPL
jgi:hypothetical protein